MFWIAPWDRRSGRNSDGLQLGRAARGESRHAVAGKSTAVYGSTCRQQPSAAGGSVQTNRARQLSGHAIAPTPGHAAQWAASPHIGGRPTDPSCINTGQAILNFSQVRTTGPDLVDITPSPYEDAAPGHTLVDYSYTAARPQADSSYALRRYAAWQSAISKSPRSSKRRLLAPTGGTRRRPADRR